ncbi:MAG: methionine ABC transporter ATP-binding protein [Zoogloeaceae bacterium]|jgi:D-methionine transport system ATP-binding protein|nr:methionine ABC transporter ATP-binding protein [Zoogloeaceae bacterium]
MIRVRRLEKHYTPGVPVLRDIDFSIEAGEVFGIVGHSGAGKSTLLRCLNGLETYQGGSIEVMGRQVKDIDGAELKALRRDMGMIFQHFSLMSRKNVFENVAFPLQIWRWPVDRVRARVMELLELVGLTEKKDARVQDLSGGQKQRVGIARALALNPKVLLCDEATSALDPDTTLTILDLLRDINRRLGITMVVVTHQMEVVRRLCGRVLMLNQGRNVALGDVEELFLAPPRGLENFLEQEFTVIPGGTNIRLAFPRDISRQAVITTMARELGVSFSIVGGRLDRYRDDVLGFLIINVAEAELEAVLGYLEKNKLYWKVLS